MLLAACCTHVDEEEDEEDTTQYEFGPGLGSEVLYQNGQLKV